MSTCQDAFFISIDFSQWCHKVKGCVSLTIAFSSPTQVGNRQRYYYHDFFHFVHPLTNNLFFLAIQCALFIVRADWNESSLDKNVRYRISHVNKIHSNPIEPFQMFGRTRMAPGTGQKRIWSGKTRRKNPTGSFYLINTVRCRMPLILIKYKLQECILNFCLSLFHNNSFLRLPTIYLFSQITRSMTK